MSDSFYVDERAYMLLQECLVAEERNIFQEGFVKGVEIAAFLAGFILPAFLLVAVIGAAWWAICKCARVWVDVKERLPGDDKH